MNNTSPPIHPVNGHGKVLWWLIGGILTPLMLTLFNTFQVSVQRVTTIEANIKELQHRFNRLENKLDLLLERR